MSGCISMCLFVHSFARLSFLSFRLELEQQLHKSTAFIAYNTHFGISIKTFEYIEKEHPLNYKSSVVNVLPFNTSTKIGPLQLLQEFNWNGLNRLRETESNVQCACFELCELFSNPSALFGTCVGAMCACVHACWCIGTRCKIIYVRK